MILFWGTPKKVRSSRDHEETHQSDSGIPGTYVPNMSEEDKQRWKAKQIDGKDPRIEIRKSFGATLLVMVVRLPPDTNDSFITLSANGKASLSVAEWADLGHAAKEAFEILVRKP